MASHSSPTTHERRALAQRIHPEEIYGPAEYRSTGNSWRRHCPIHGGNNPSAFAVFKDQLGFKCYSCGASGSALDFLILNNGWGYLEALKEYRRLGGLSTNPTRRPRRRPPLPPKAPRSKGPSDYTSWIGPALEAPFQPDQASQAFLEKRFPGVPLSDFQGTLLDTRQLKRSKKSKGNEYGLLIPQYSIAQAGRILGGRYRLTNPGPDFKGPKSRAVKGTRSGRFGSTLITPINEALESARNPGPGFSQKLHNAFKHLGGPLIILAEGEPDGITLRFSLGLKNVITVAGTSEARKAVYGLLEKTSFTGTLLLALHGDEAGEKACQEIQQLAAQHPYRLQLVRPDFASLSDEDNQTTILDLNDELLTKGPTAVFRRLRKATLLPPGDRAKTYTDPFEVKKTLEESQFKNLLGFLEHQPASSEVKGLRSIQKAMRCEHQSWIINSRAIITHDGVSYQTIPVDRCNSVWCLKCRQDLLRRNAKNLETWLNNDEITQIVVPFQDQQVSALYDLRSVLTDKSLALRNKIGAENYGFVPVIQPGRLTLFITQNKGSSLTDKIIELLYDRPRKVERLGGKTASLEFGKALIGFATMLIETEQELESLNSEDRSQRVLSQNWFINPQVRRKTFSKAHGKLLPFIGDLKKTNDNPAPALGDELIMNIYGRYDKGVQAVTRHVLDDTNKSRAFFGHRLALWDDINLAAAWVNAPELFPDAASRLMIDIGQRFGGFDRDLTDPHWQQDLSKYDYGRLLETFDLICRILDPPDQQEIESPAA